MGTVRVIGCGNPDGGDDAAGLLAVRRARPDLERMAGVDVVEAGPGLRLFDLVEGPDAVVVVDAVRSSRGRRPGQVVRAEAGPGGLPAIGAGSLSSHGFGVAEVVAVAAAMGRVPQLIFLGVEAGDVTAGHPLSEPVARAIPELAGLVTAEATRLVGESP